MVFCQDVPLLLETLCSSFGTPFPRFFSPHTLFDVMRTP